MDWYILFTQTGQEYFTQKWISKLFSKDICNAIVPQRILTERKGGKKYQIIRTLFPGYVFLNTNMNEKIYYKLKDIPSTIKILGYDNYYSKVDQSEISLILKLMGNSDIITYSKVIIESSDIYVTSGPLKGNEEIIKKINKRKQRATVALNLMNDIKTIDLGIELISPI